MIPALSPETLALLVLLGKATVVLVVAFAGATLLERAPAGARHLLWLSTLGAILFLPALSTWSPLRLAVLPVAWLVPHVATPDRGATAPNATSPVASDDARRATSTRAPSTVSPGETAAAGADEVQLQGALAAAPAATAWRPTMWQLLLGAWAAVALALGGWLAIGFLSVRRIVRRATPLVDRKWSAPLYDIADRLGVDRTPRLVRSEDVKMPFAAGLVSPTVVLPAECDTWDEARRRAVLLHELAHIARNDLLGHTLGRVACALYWFHPLVWRAARRLRVESERACDDLALSCGVRPSSYAEHLLDIVTSIRQPLTPATAIPMADRKEFEGRMLAILDPEVRRQGSRRQSLVVVTGLLGVAALVGGTTPTAARASTAPLVAREPAVPNVDRATPRGDTANALVVPSSRLAQGSGERRPETGRRDATPRAAAVDSADPVGAILATMTAATAAQDQPATRDRRDDRAELLMQVLRADTSAGIRRTAAWGLSRYAERADVVTALAQALRSDKDQHVREMAAWALGGGDDTPASRAALLAALGGDSDADVRESAAWALGQTTDSHSAPEVDDALAKALGDASPRVRAHAMWAIGRVGEGKVPAAVLTALESQDERDRQVRVMAAWVLFRREDATAVPAIERALGRETDGQVRVALIRALGALGESSAPALARLLDSPDRDVRAAVVGALAGRNGGPWPMPMPRPRPFP
ncbi:MAG: HEAT repeat domain-containing protein [Gemmatimonadaceae bacterium]|nr:HEAT repeat domain-containing protein [Gemmatimonadaceae bacterium]